MADDFVADLLERLAPLGELRARRMFGGSGLYCDDVFFGLIAEGVLFFRVDEASVQPYRDAGSAPFQPFPDEPSMLAYYEVPLEVQERGEELLAWARRALAAAHARDESKAKAKRKGAARSAPARTAAVPLAKLPNIGPKSAAWLRAIGIRTRAELERVGSVRAYRRVAAAAGRAVPLDLLYALEGALLDLQLERMPAVVKQNLRERLEREAERKPARRQRAARASRRSSSRRTRG